MLDYLLQEPLWARARRMGLDIPEQYVDSDYPYKTILTAAGEAWVTRQINDYRMARAKDWTGIIMPILSALIAILGLIVALRK